MSKFLSQKKKLLEEVYEKATKEATEESFSGIILHLERTLKDEYEGLSYKSFENYYKSIVEQDEDYNIKRPILDNLSNYLGYDSFKNYCSDWKTIEYTVQQAISKIVINIVNKPILTMPDFIRNNGFGIMEMTFVLLLCTGGLFFSNGKNNNSGLNNPLKLIMGEKPDIEKAYMYWNGEKYIATDSNSLGPDKNIIAMNEDKFLNFKKNMRSDTLNSENSMHKAWYDKSNNHVEFFTSPGIHPENGKALKDVTEGILYNYAGEGFYAEK